MSVHKEMDDGHVDNCPDCRNIWLQVLKGAGDNDGEGYIDENDGP